MNAYSQLEGIFDMRIEERERDSQQRIRNEQRAQQQQHGQQQQQRNQLPTSTINSNNDRQGAECVQAIMDYIEWPEENICHMRIKCNNKWQLPNNKHNTLKYKMLQSETKMP